MNKVIIAAAGSGKTQTIVQKAFAEQRPVLVTTYTDSNAEEVRSRFYELCGAVPKNVHILPWYTFLLNYGVRPYQDIFIQDDIKGVNLVNGQSSPYTKKFTKPFYIDKETKIYSDKLASLMLYLNERTKGQVLHNISEIFPVIFVDEVQDMAGYDLDALEALFAVETIDVTGVGDPRQGILMTSKINKNKAFRQSRMMTFFQKRVGRLVNIDLTSLQTNYRCVDEICALSNRLYPEYPPVHSGQTKTDVHRGCFFVRPEDVGEYITYVHPVQLRQRVTVPASSLAPVNNFGVVKGLSFNHVLIYPTADMLAWLKTGNSEMKPTTCAQLYVAITRARYSVAFVCDYREGQQVSPHTEICPFK